jgi:hypothetical protein
MRRNLSEEQIAQEVEANLAAVERLAEFHRDEAAWEEIWEGLFAIVTGYKAAVHRAFGLDPRRSVLYAEFPDLLWSACDPQQPITYDPVFREFGIPVFDGGPSQMTLSFDPWTGRALPGSVRDAYFDEAEKRFGPDVGILDDILDTLPQEFRSEAWWIARDL